MKLSPDADLTERLAYKRAHLATGLAAVFLALQTADLSNGRANGHLDIPFLIWCTLLIVILCFGNGWFSGAKVRAALNDETTRVHRQMAMASGFLVTLAGAIFVYLLTFYEPVSGPAAVRILITLGLAGALFRFAALEKKAMRP